MLEKFISDARSVSLKEEEKSAMRQTLVSFVRTHPVMIGVETRQVEQRPGILQGLVSLMFKPMPLVLIIALIFGGSASFAAEQALPGDALYPVKVRVNEEVRGWVTLTPEAKAQWEARKAERRLLEAEKLVSRGEFNTQASAHIEENFEAHAQRVTERTEAFSDKENFEAAADVSARFETSLMAHERILEKLVNELEGTENAHGELTSLTQSVGARLAIAARARASAEGRVSGITQAQAGKAAEGKKRSAENKIAEVRRLIERAKDSLGPEATLKAAARLTVAEQRVAEGRVKMDAGAYGEAFMLLSEAHQVAQEGKLLIEARRTLQLNLDLNGTAKERHGTRADMAEEVEIGESVDELEAEIKSLEGDIEAESEAVIDGGMETDAGAGGQTDVRGSVGGADVEGSAGLELGL